jgi:hypothetical protein
MSKLRTKTNTLKVRYRIYCRAPLIVSYHKDDKKKKRLKRLLCEQSNGFITGLEKATLFEHFANAIRPSKRGKPWIDVRLVSGEILQVNQKYFKIKKQG